MDGSEVKAWVKPQRRPFGRRWWGAVASFLLLEEGCHSAGFVTTIHVRHHLLLSLGWQLIVVPLNEWLQYVIFQIGCQ